MSWTIYKNAENVQRINQELFKNVQASAHPDCTSVIYLTQESGSLIEGIKIENEYKFKFVFLANLLETQFEVFWDLIIQHRMSNISVSLQLHTHINEDTPLNVGCKLFVWLIDKPLPLLRWFFSRWCPKMFTTEHYSFWSSIFWSWQLIVFSPLCRCRFVPCINCWNLVLTFNTLTFITV